MRNDQFLTVAAAARPAAPPAAPPNGAAIAPRPADLSDAVAQLAALSEASGFSMTVLVDIAKKLLEAGMPPDVDNKEALRGWLATIGQAILLAAHASPNEIDDQIAQFVEKLLSVDDLWDVIYGLLHRLIKHNEDVDAELTALAPRVGINPVVILQIIALIKQIIEMWSK